LRDDSILRFIVRVSFPSDQPLSAMSLLDSIDTELRMSLSKWLLGFFSGVAIYLLLPKALKYLVRRFAVGLITEVAAVVLAGFLAEKASRSFADER
jgi:hypothetical protein